MQIAVCLVPERELAAELVVFTQTHTAALGGESLSLTSNRPRLVLCSGEVDEWQITPELLDDLSPAAPFRARFGTVTVSDGLVLGPIGLMDPKARRALLGLQARATVRLDLHLPARWVPGIPLGHTGAGRLHPRLRADWDATMDGRDVLLNRLAFLRLDDAGHAVGSVASHVLGS